MDTPRTASGRALLYDRYPPSESYIGRDSLLRGILAIEAEAAAPAEGLDVEVLARALQIHLRTPPGWQSAPQPADLRRAADTFGKHAEAIAAIYARLAATEGEQE